MATKSDATLLTYKHSRIELEKQCDLYTLNNVKPDITTGYINVRTEEALEVYNAISDVIHKAVIYYDMQKDKDNIKSVLNKYEKRYMSAVKYIDNLIKHEKIDIEIHDIIHVVPVYRVMPTIYTNGEKGIWFGMGITFMWRDLSFIPYNKEFVNQKNNYKRYLENKYIPETDKKIHEIIIKIANVNKQII